MISILIPYGPDGGWRDRAFEWNLARWKHWFPAAEICIGEPDEWNGTAGEFNRPQAINRAAREATGGILVVADADTTFSSGFQVVDDWVLPRSYAKLTEEFTHQLLAVPEAVVEPWLFEWEGASWSGLLVLPREAFELVGGFDERFTGWGHDDIAFGVCVDTLYRPHLRGEYSALHLWHPTPFVDNYGQPNNEVQRLLAVEYVKAAGHPARMRAVMKMWP